MHSLILNGEVNSWGQQVNTDWHAKMAVRTVRAHVRVCTHCTVGLLSVFDCKFNICASYFNAVYR